MQPARLRYHCSAPDPGKTSDGETTLCLGVSTEGLEPKVSGGSE